MPPTDPAAAHGSFKFTCVGYGQRAIEDTAERAGRRLPYCEGLQIPVADATQVGRHASGDRRSPAADPAAAAALVRDLEALRRRRDDAVPALREAAARSPGDREKIAGLEKRARERGDGARAAADARRREWTRASDGRDPRALSSSTPGTNGQTRTDDHSGETRTHPLTHRRPWPSRCARGAARVPRAGGQRAPAGGGRQGTGRFLPERRVRGQVREERGEDSGKT